MGSQGWCGSDCEHHASSWCPLRGPSVILKTNRNDHGWNTGPLRSCWIRCTLNYVEMKRKCLQRCLVKAWLAWLYMIVGKEWLHMVEWWYSSVFDTILCKIWQRFWKAFHNMCWRFSGSVRLPVTTEQTGRQPDSLSVHFFNSLNISKIHEDVSQEFIQFTQMGQWRRLHSPRCSSAENSTASIAN